MEDMNKRQKKKMFKKKYGINPPKKIRTSLAGSLTEAIKNNKSAWEKTANTLIGLGRIMHKIHEKILEDQTQENIRKLQCKELENTWEE